MWLDVNVFLLCRGNIPKAFEQLTGEFDLQPFICAARADCGVLKA